MKFAYRYTLFILIFLFCVFNYTSDETTIYGKYFTTPDKNLKGIELEVIIKKPPSDKSYTYKTTLTRDGKFKVKIKEKGLCYVFIGMHYYPPKHWLNSNPYLSNRVQPYSVNIIGGEKILLDKYLYIREPLTVSSPIKRETVSIKKNSLFEWEKDIYADIYRISLYLKKNNYKPEWLINAYINSPFINIKDIFNATIINDISDIKTVRGLLPFITIDGKPVSGNCILIVEGFKLIDDENRIIKTSESNKIMINIIIPEDIK